MPKVQKFLANESGIHKSGPGKGQTGRAILGLTPASGTVTANKLRFDGIDLRKATARTWRSLRGPRKSMIMQDPKYSLNPVMIIGRQIVEAYRRRGDATRGDARAKAVAMLKAMQIRDAERVFNAYTQGLLNCLPQIDGDGAPLPTLTRDPAWLA